MLSRNVPPRILLFSHRDQGRGVGTFDADKNPDEVRPVHQHNKFVVIGEIDRGFGRELEWIVVLFKPLCELGRNAFDGLFVTDEVIVDEINVTAIAQPIKLV